MSRLIVCARLLQHVALAVMWNLRAARAGIVTVRERHIARIGQGVSYTFTVLKIVDCHVAVLQAELTTRAAAVSPMIIFPTARRVSRSRTRVMPT